MLVANEKKGAKKHQKQLKLYKDELYYWRAPVITCFPHVVPNLRTGWPEECI